MKKVIKDILKKQIINIIFIIIFIIAFEYFKILLSSILGSIIDLFSNIENGKIMFKKQIGLFLGSTVLICVSRFFGRNLVTDTVQNFARLLRNSIFEIFLKMKLSDIQNIKNGEIMSYLTKDISDIKRFYYMVLSKFLKACITLILCVIAMNNIDTKLTIIILFPMIITLIIIIMLKKCVEKSYKKSKKHFTEVSEYVQESTDAIRTTKSYSEESSKIEEFIKKNDVLRKSDILVDKYSSMLSVAITMCLGISYGIIILYGSNLVINKLITVGDFVTFTGYVTTLFNPIFYIPNIISNFEKSRVSYRRLNKLFILRSEINDFNKKDYKKIFGDIEFKNLEFKYPNTEETVLKNINLKIKKGSTLGIIGTIGSGKTTIVNLLDRLYDVGRGQIYIDGKDINDIDVFDLRNSICYITQDNFLFSTTIKENITVFKDYFEEYEIRKSTEEAMFSEDLERMKNHIDTIIGERGIELSGGQKQRVVISRSFLNKSNIIIFDDTFSALDNKTEEQILNNIKNLTENKTCIIISNRISDVKDADNIIVLDDGRIVEQGTHMNLLKNNGLYNKFYMQQASSYNSETV